MGDPDWADHEKIVQDDGPLPLCTIAYSEEFIEAHDRFRFVCANKEYSKRALALTERIFELNSASYTAWWFRRRCLEALGSDLKAELEFVAGWAMDSPKNYQVWAHRRWLAERTSSFEAEAEFCQSMLDDDAKNFNSWAHRQFCVKHFKQWGAEAEFAQRMIKRDLRNNSAWAYLWWVRRNQPETSFGPEERAQERAYAIEQLKMAPHNEAASNYLIAVWRAGGDGEGDAEVEEAAAAMLSSMDDNRFALHLMALLAERQGKREEATALLSKCQASDPIRKLYWQWRVDGHELARPSTSWQ
mmetsp:Transcript_44275/g.101129  ORF Transcript_44275/g.101129 Transcript_44275/m.101129 type:complete len:301 (+) Transcript_44275:33-935(+)